MLISRNLRMKSSKVSIKTRSTPASLSFKGQATKHTTVKWSIFWGSMPPDPPSGSRLRRFACPSLSLIYPCYRTAVRCQFKKTAEQFKENQRAGSSQVVSTSFPGSSLWTLKSSGVVGESLDFCRHHRWFATNL